MKLWCYIDKLWTNGNFSITVSTFYINEYNRNKKRANGTNGALTELKKLTWQTLNQC